MTLEDKAQNAAQVCLHFAHRRVIVTNDPVCLKAAFYSDKRADFSILNFFRQRFDGYIWTRSCESQEICLNQTKNDEKKY